MSELKQNNMALWDAVCETDPSHTKHVSQKGGFTAIDAMYQIQEATKLFGAVGVGWGWSYELMFPPNDTIIANVTLWHGTDDQVVRQCGQKNLNSGKGADEDAAKKAVTDGLTKCLSYLGFNADVFLGKFDDNKYVQEMTEKHKEVAPYQITEEESRTINDICHLIKCGQSEADMKNVFAEYEVDMSGFGIEGDKESNDVCQVAINSQEDEMKKVWAAGNQAQNIKYKFNNVQHGLDEFARMGKEMHAFKSLPMLEAYHDKWAYKIAAMKGYLDAHKKDELTPHQRIENLYNKKIQELN